MGRIRVFVADWQVLFRKGVCFTLAGVENMEVVGDSSNNEEALKYVKSNLPDVFILNVNDGKSSGTQITRTIRQNLPSVSVILVMDHQNNSDLFAAMKSGASACITKDIDPSYLISVINNVAGGAKPISKALLNGVIARYVLGVGEMHVKLSSNEAGILMRIAEGNSAEQTAKTLGLSEGSLNNQLISILSKLLANEEESVSRRLVDFFRARGYKVEESAKMKGKSGVIHSLDILASRDDQIVQHTVGIGVFTVGIGEVEVSTDDLLTFQTKAVDVGIHSLCVVAIPRLSPQARSFADAQQIKVLTLQDIRNLSSEQPQFTSVTEPPGSSRVQLEGTGKGSGSTTQEALRPVDLKKVLWFGKDLTFSGEFGRALRTAGFEVTVFADLDDELHKVNEASIVVIDDELSLARQLCSRIREQSHIPIVIISSEKSEEGRRGVEDLNADAYVNRSISGRELVARIRSILRRC